MKTKTKTKAKTKSKVVKPQTVLYFAYGSLKRGHWNHHRLNACYYKTFDRAQSDATFVGNATVDGFSLILYAYPFAYPKADSSITGEVYEILPDALVHLDAMEIQAGYSRKTCKAKLEDGRELETFIYVANPDTVKRIRQHNPDIAEGPTWGEGLLVS